LPINTETNNSDNYEQFTTKPNVDIKIKEKTLKKFKKSDIKLSNKLEKSIEKQSSPIEALDKSLKCHEKISESNYNPTKKDYHPIKDAFWDYDQP